MTRNTLGRVLVLALVLGLAGCKDLKIETKDDQKKFRFSKPTTMWLTYKKKRDLPTDADITWYSNKDGEIGRGPEITVHHLSPGKHEIRAKGTYKGKDVESKKKKIEILNDRPQPKITAPLPGAKIGVGKNVRFQATATDREDGTVPGSALTWRSSLEGPLGSGDVLDRSDLRPGVHTITITAEDRAGATAEATIKVEITNQAPVAVIDRPASAVQVKVGETVTFKGHGEDADAVAGPRRITDDISWRSNRDGRLGEGSSLSVDGLSGGKHDVEMQVKDEFGAVGKATVRVEVKNRAPKVEITSPEDDRYFSVADSVRFEANVRDPDGFAIEDHDVEWRSNRDGKFGTGTSVLTDRLSAGEHRITCKVTDRHGASRETRIKVLMVNEEPVARISTSSGTFDFGETIVISGSASDKEDGQVRSSGLTWRVLKEGNTNKRTLGSGDTIKVKDLPFGTHRIFLIAKDSDGAESKPVSIRVTVRNKAPNVTIASPVDRSEVTEGNEVTFTGSALDPDRNVWLDGANLTWKAQRAGSVTRTLGNGREIKVNDLKAGRYMIILVASDPDDSTITARTKIRLRVKAAPTPPPTTTTNDPNGNSNGVTNTINTIGD